MSLTGAPEPLDETPSTAASAADGMEPYPDLDAVPAFLRDRRVAPIPAPAVEGGVHRSIARAAEVAALPMIGIAPRRLVFLGASLVLAWMVISFGRQVADASAASARADELRAANATLALDVAALERELQTIGEQRYIEQAARAFRLGSAREIPFALAPGAPPLDANAPGSESVRLGADDAGRSPVETWLDVLFGPQD
jgi:cell division protein FtsB